MSNRNNSSKGCAIGAFALAAALAFVYFATNWARAHY